MDSPSKVPGIISGSIDDVVLAASELIESVPGASLFGARVVGC